MYIREKQLRLCTYSINNMTQRKFLYILYMYNSDIEKQKKKKNVNSTLYVYTLYIIQQFTQKRNTSQSTGLIRRNRKSIYIQGLILSLF